MDLTAIMRTDSGKDVVPLPIPMPWKDQPHSALPADTMRPNSPLKGNRTYTASVWETTKRIKELHPGMIPCGGLQPIQATHVCLEPVAGGFCNMVMKLTRSRQGNGDADVSSWSTTKAIDHHKKHHAASRISAQKDSADETRMGKRKREMDAAGAFAKNADELTAQAQHINAAATLVKASSTAYKQDTVGVPASTGKVHNGDSKPHGSSRGGLKKQTTAASIKSKEDALTAMAEWVMYSSPVVDFTTLKDPLFLEMMATYWGSQDAPKLTYEMLSKYIQDEKKTMMEYLRYVMDKQASQMQGNAFAQLVRDGGFLANTIGYKAVAAHFMAPEWGRNVVVCVGFSAGQCREDPSEAEDITDEQLQQKGIKLEIFSGSESQEHDRLSDAGGLEEEGWGLWESDHVGAWALGLIRRRKGRELVNACSEAAAVCKRVQSVREYFLQDDSRYVELHKICSERGLPQIRFPTEVKEECVHKLLYTVLRMQSALQAYSELHAQEGCFTMDSSDLAYVREFEGVLNLTWATSYTEKRAVHVNMGMEPIYRIKLMMDLRGHQINLVDLDKSSAASKVARVSVAVSALTPLAQTVRERAILEAEKRYCGNATHHIQYGDVRVSQRELVAVGLDPRSLIVLDKIFPSADIPRVTAAVKDLYVRFGVQCWRYAKENSGGGLKSASVGGLTEVGDVSGCSKTFGAGEKSNAGFVPLSFGGELLGRSVDAGVVSSVGDEDSEELETERLMQEFENVYAKYRILGMTTIWKEYISDHKLKSLDAGASLDVLEDLVDADMLKFFRDVTTQDLEREKKQYGHLLQLAACVLRGFSPECFQERVKEYACEMLLPMHERVLPDLIEDVVMLRMNRDFVVWAKGAFGDEIAREVGVANQRTRVVWQ